MIIIQFFVRKIQPINRSTFYIFLVLGLLLLALVWLTEFKGENQYRILLTVMALLTIIHSYLSYKKSRKTTSG